MSQHDSTAKDIRGDCGIHITFRNFHGSVQHYYHFLFAFVVPLIRVWNSITISAYVTNIFVRSCAIMDELLYQLRLPGLVIMDATEHAAMYDRRAQSANSAGLQFITLDGYDDPVRYDAGVFRSVRDLLHFRFSDEIRREMQEINESFTGSGPRIVIITRLPADKFYSQADCEIKTAGSERRSIANVEELRAAASLRSDNVVVAALEGRSLFYQMALFAAADVVISQHGAALGNLIWCKDTTTVIEIIPKERKDGIQECDYFGDLARCLSLKYYRLWQDLPHGPVDIADFTNILHTITANASAVRSPSTILSSLPKDSGSSRMKVTRRSVWLTWQRLRNLTAHAVGRRAS